MLTVAPPPEPDVISDSLAGILGLLHPNAAMGSRLVVLDAARRSTGKFLRRLRHHLHENGLLLGALEKAEPACRAPRKRIAGVHAELRRLSHELSRRLRTDDAAGARGVARALLALYLEHSARERRLVNHVLRKLDLEATCRFADALLERMLNDIGVSGGERSSRQSVVDLHAHYLGLIRRLQGRTQESPTFEVIQENSCR
jgi:hypothetical protein